MRTTVNILIAVELPAWWEDMAIRRYRIFASPEAEIIGSSLSPAQQEAANKGNLLEQLVENGREAERRASFVHILDCFGDPLLAELNQRLRAPVVGVGESSMLAASSWFDSFAVITSEEGTGEKIRAHAKQAGVSGQLMDCRAIGVSAADIPADREDAFQRLLPHARELAANGADAVLLGCTELAMMASSLREHLRAEGISLEVVNPIAVAQRWAEMTVWGRTQGQIIT